MALPHLNQASRSRTVERPVQKHQKLSDSVRVSGPAIGSRPDLRHCGPDCYTKYHRKPKTAFVEFASVGDRAASMEDRVYESADVRFCPLRFGKLDVVWLSFLHLPLHPATTRPIREQGRPCTCLRPSMKSPNRSREQSEDVKMAEALPSSWPNYDKLRRMSVFSHDCVMYVTR